MYCKHTPITLYIYFWITKNFYCSAARTWKQEAKQKKKLERKVDGFCVVGGEGGGGWYFSGCDWSYCSACLPHETTVNTWPSYGLLTTPGVFNKCLFLALGFLQNSNTFVVDSEANIYDSIFLNTWTNNKLRLSENRLGPGSCLTQRVWIPIWLLLLQVGYINLILSVLRLLTLSIEQDQVLSS